MNCRPDPESAAGGIGGKTDIQHMSECIRAIADRKDKSAFEALFRFYGPRIKAVLMKSGATAHEAEEVMQETIVLIWRKAEQYDPKKASPSTWIYTIARNRRIDLFRRENRPALDPEDPYFSQSSSQPDGEQVSTEKQRTRMIRDRLKTLPDNQQILVRKAFYEDMTHQAIATELDMPLGTVKSRLRIAMRDLREQLSGAEL